MSVLQDSQRTEVIDPYYGGGADFEKVFADCRDATEAWISMWEPSPQKKWIGFHSAGQWADERVSSQPESGPARQLAKIGAYLQRI